MWSRIKRNTLPVGLIIVIALLITGAMTLIPKSLAQEGEIALVNPGFESDVVEHSQRVIVGEGWTPIHWDRESMISGGSSGRSAQPEYKPLPVAVDPHRVHSGEQSQCWFWFYTHGDAAIYQRVRVRAGYYRLEAWAQAWVSNSDENPHSSPGEMYVSLGIDPEGRDPGGWPWETSVVWSPFWLVRGQYERVESRIVYVESDDWVTVYLRAWKKWDQKHGDVYWDDVRLMRVDGLGSETPAPCPTCIPAETPSPCPTYVPGGSCPNLGDIRAAMETVIAEREPVRWPR